MKRRIGVAVGATVAMLVLGAALPAAPGHVGPALPAVAEEAEAQADAKGGSGGSRAENVGGNAADLLQGWIGPLLLIFIGVLAFVALFTRNVGMAVSAMMIGLISGLFIFAPDSAETTFKNIYDAIF